MNEAPHYVVRPGQMGGIENGLWVLYETSDGGFDVVAWFRDRTDAEFVKNALTEAHYGAT